MISANLVPSATTRVIVGEFLTMLSEVAGSKLDGIVGCNFLRHYQVVIDYPNEIFRLE